jgi:superfamily II DNA or RNA helicase
MSNKDRSKMNLTLSGNLLMLDPWLPQLEKELFFWRRDYDPTKQTKMTRENMYYVHEVDGKVVGYVPEGLYYRVCDYLKKINMPFSTIDHRRWNISPDYDFSHVDVLDLREGQDVALVRVAENYMGVLEAPTGFGKTFLIRQICKMYPNLNIVICTPRKSVVKSIYERLTADTFLSDNIGVISSWKNTGADFRVTVSTVRSLLKTNYQKCDLLLFDECQGVGAVGTAELISKFTNARKFGFSASPEGRGDGADMVLESLFGPVIFDFSYQDAVDSGSVVPIEVIMHTVEGDPINKQGKIALKRWGIWRNDNRNKRIAEVVKHFGPDEQVLIMVETIEHAMHLKKLLPEYAVVYSNCSKERYQGYVTDGYTTDPYINDKDMMEMQDKFESGEIMKCISTMKWREGVDFVKLRGLVRADGLAGAIPSTQIPGRLSRLDENKEKGVLIDFIDEFDDRLKGSSYSRVSNYRKLNWSVTYADKF